MSSNCSLFISSFYLTMMFSLLILSFTAKISTQGGGMRHLQFVARELSLLSPSSTQLFEGTSCCSMLVCILGKTPGMNHASV